jgi:anti-sigma factor RsiW
MSHIGAAAAGAVAMVLWFAQPPKTDPLADAVGGHIRVLLNEQHKSVASNDSHVVRPWFAGKIDFAPRVPELGAAGFPLLGGRVDTLRRRTAAAILYGRREHRITLLVSPNETRAPREPTSGSERGYHAIGWADAEFVYWVVSDLNPRELAEFADLARDAVAGGAKPASDPRS